MVLTLSSTPRQDGFYMPGEFETHTGCWMLWPERSDNWRLNAFPAQAAFAAVAGAIAHFERVTIGVSSDQYRKVHGLLPPEVRVVELQANDSWMRDMGPTFVIDKVTGERRGVDWDFNAWGGLDGGLYFPWDQDALVAQKVLEIEGCKRYKAPMVLEGGSIHVDGQGTLITTRECLLNPNRNPQLSQTEIETILGEYLNIDHIIWLPFGVYNDETNGHIDNLVCFIRPGVVALTWTDDPGDPQYDISHEAEEILCTALDGRGRQLEVHRILQPGPLYITAEEAQGVDPVEGTYPRHEGDRMAASYINFYLANKGVIVPLFDVSQDGPALAKLKELFPEREITGVQAREILLGGGNIHCITQQVPGTE